MWECRSPRRSSSVDELGQRAGRARPPARRGPRAARAGSTAGRAARRPASSVAQRSVSPVASSRMPYSETCSPRRTAASRSATLWSLEPVKCWSTLPNWSGATILRSTLMPAWQPHARAGLAGLLHRLDERRARSAPATSAAGSAVVAMMSRSLTESALRRSEPATSTRSAPGAARSASAISLGDRQRAREQPARRGRAVVARGERLEQLLLGLRAEPAQAAQLLAPRPPRAASRASRCPARRRAGARASGRSRAGASSRSARSGTARAASATA